MIWWGWTVWMELIAAVNSWQFGKPCKKPGLGGHSSGNQAKRTAHCCTCLCPICIQFHCWSIKEEKVTTTFCRDKSREKTKTFLIWAEITGKASKSLVYAVLKILGINSVCFASESTRSNFLQIYTPELLLLSPFLQLHWNEVTCSPGCGCVRGSGDRNFGFKSKHPVSELSSDLTIRVGRWVVKVNRK